MADDADRTFEPTDQRREQFRKDGRFAQAKDIGGIAATVGVLGALTAGKEKLGHAMEVLFHRTLGDLGSFDHPEAVRGATFAVFEELAPILLSATVLAVLASGVQTKFRPNLDAISWKLERLNPMQRIGRLFAFKKNAVGLLMSLGRAALVAGIAYQAVKRELPMLLGMSRASLGEGAGVMAGTVSHVASASLLVLFLLAGADYAYSWFTLQQDLKMTFQERKDEHRQSEGDAKTKHKIKAKGRALSKKRAMNAVKNADVIVTNPTHYAVALRYGAKDAAPMVLAKGTDEQALEIRAEARKHGIPILENRPLARALYAEVPVGRPIPQAHFAAVAKILAFVFRLKKKGAFD